MPRLTIEISTEVMQHLERIVRDGWYVDQQAIVREAIEQLVEGKTLLGDSPRMLHRFAADALNESKPDTALKFLDRAVSLLTMQKMMDMALYQAVIELRVQVLLVLEREADALASVKEATERLPNNPTIARWMQRLSPRST